MQGAATATHHARFLAEDLGVHLPGRHAPGKQVAMVAMRGKSKITLFQQVQSRHTCYLLSDIDMKVTNVAVTREIDQLFFEASDQYAEPQLLDDLIVGEIG
jgi:hypothetical protein